LVKFHSENWRGYSFGRNYFPNLKGGTKNQAGFIGGSWLGFQIWERGLLF